MLAPAIPQGEGNKFGAFLLKIRRSYVVASAFVVAIAAWLLSGQFGDDGPVQVAESPARAEQTVPQVRVRTLAAETRTNFVVVNGRTEAARSVTLRAQTSGRVAEIGQPEGSIVSAGDVVVRLAMDDRQARLAEAKAEVARRRLEHNAASALSQKAFASELRLAEATAALEEAQAQLALIQLDIERTAVRAPFGGVLQSRAVEMGDYLAVGGEVARIIDLTPILAVGDVTEREVGRVELAATGEVRLVGGIARQGRVTYVSASARPGTRTFTVKMEVDNPDRAIAEGLTAEIRVPAGTVSAHLVSPSVLTLDDAGRIGAKTVDERGVVAFHPVSLVSDGPEGVWITGLPDPATIITIGQEFVRAGDKVRAVPETEIAGR